MHGHDLAEAQVLAQFGIARAVEQHRAVVRVDDLGPGGVVANVVDVDAAEPGDDAGRDDRRRRGAGAIAGEAARARAAAAPRE